MEDFIYDVFVLPIAGLIYGPFYPATILLFIYISYALIKKRAISKWKIFGLSLFSLLPTLLMILLSILEITFVPGGGYKFALMLLVTGIGVVVNLISTILLIIYFFKHRAKTQIERPARAQ